MPVSLRTASIARDAVRKLTGILPVNLTGGSLSDIYLSNQEIEA